MSNALYKMNLQEPITSLLLANKYGLMMVSRIKTWLVIITLVSFYGCTSEETSNLTTTVSGKLINWGNASKILKAEDIKADFGLGQSFILETDENDHFTVSFELEESTYFSIGRNKLFIQPGEKLDMEVDYRDPEAGLFNGDGADRQSYLSGVAFPKGGSYLSGGREVKGNDIAHILELVQLKTMQRRELLGNVTNATSEFLMLEEMRLKLDYLNTILSFPVYGSFKDYWEYNENKKVEVLLGAKNELNMATSGMIKDAHMKHPNFRDMLLTFASSRLKDAGIFNELKLTDFMVEYDAMGAFVTELQLDGLTAEMKTKADDFIQGDHSEEYQNMVKLKVDEYAALEIGEPAFDVIFKDTKGKEIPLSNYKGKLIYVDLWATWCGPCIAELPAFEQLVKDYAGENIAFVPVSIDTDLEKWKKFMEKNNMHGTELVINRVDLSDYKVITIPRYILIDQDFKIINVFATVPSDPKTRDLIDQYLGD